MTGMTGIFWEVFSLRRVMALLLCLSLAVIPVRAEESPKYVALTFDDGPSGRFTRRLLDGLQERQVLATFFLCGYRLKDYQSLACRIYEEGHEIGLHGYSHKDLGKMSYAAVCKELRDTQALLPQGCQVKLLRPPGGSCGEALTRAARDAGLAIVNWSVDPRDWDNHDAAAVEAAVVDTVRSGDIVLLHDMCDCSVDAALGIIDQLQQQGFRFVTVSQLAALKGTALQPGKVYGKF